MCFEFNKLLSRKCILTVLITAAINAAFLIDSSRFQSNFFCRSVIALQNWLDFTVLYSRHRIPDDLVTKLERMSSVPFTSDTE